MKTRTYAGIGLVSGLVCAMAFEFVWAARAQTNVTLEPPFKAYLMDMNTATMKEHAHIPAGWKLTAASDNAIWFTDAAGNVYMLRLLKNGTEPVVSTSVYEIQAEQK